MKNIFFILMMMYSFSSCAQETKSFQLISQKEFAKILINEVQLLDVRTPEEYQQGFIEGAILINFFDSNFATQVSSTFNKNKPLYIYCAAGGRSNKAATKLGLEGFHIIYDLEGGYNSWKKFK